MEQIILWLTQYKYLAVFPLTVIEGPIVTIIIGGLVSAGFFNFFVAYAIVVAGDLAGDAAHYAIGRWGGEKFINKWGKYVGVGADEVEALEGQFKQRGSKLLFIGKMSHGIGGAFLIAAGVIKMPFNKFITANLLATLIKSLLLLVVGYYFGYALTAINSTLEKISAATIGAVIILISVHFMYFRKNRGNSTSQNV